MAFRVRMWHAWTCDDSVHWLTNGSLGEMGYPKCPRYVLTSQQQNIKMHMARITLREIYSQLENLKPADIPLIAEQIINKMGIISIKIWEYFEIDIKTFIDDVKYIQIIYIWCDLMMMILIVYKCWYIQTCAFVSVFILIEMIWNIEQMGTIRFVQKLDFHNFAVILRVVLQWVECRVWYQTNINQDIPLTHWGRDWMCDIFQTTFSNVFSWIKMYEFRLKFDWSLFLRSI